MTTSEMIGLEVPQATSADYRQALLTIRDLRTTSHTVWTLWVGLLTAHYGMPGHVATAAQLATTTRLKSPGTANLSYGKLAHAVADQLGHCPPKRETGKRDPRWWMTLAAGSQGDEKDEDFQFTMHPELAAALEVMRWVRPQTTQA